MIRIKKYSIVSFLITLYLFICIFFPLDPYKLKFVVIGLLFMISFEEYIRFISKTYYVPIFFIGCIYPILLFLFSFGRNGSLGNSISQAYVPLLILILIPVFNNDIDLEKMICSFLCIEAILVVSIVMLDILHIFDVNDSPIRSFYYYWGMGFMGKSQSYAAYYKVFFKTSPMLILLFDYAWRNNKKIICIITALALLFSGTRANIIALSGYVTYCIFFNNSKNELKKFIIKLFFIIGVICFFSYLTRSFEAMMSADGSVKSDHVRSGQMKGLLEALSNPITFVLGDGFGTMFYDYGRNKYISGVELSYIDLLRQIGILMFIPFMIFILFPLSSNINKQTKIAYIGYMLIAWTNPLLFTSTAFLVYAYVYWLIYHPGEKIKNNNLFRRYAYGLYYNP